MFYKFPDGEVRKVYTEDAGAGADSLDMTTNQIVSHCIDDWVDLGYPQYANFNSNASSNGLLNIPNAYPFKRIDCCFVPLF